MSAGVGVVFNWTALNSYLDYAQQYGKDYHDGAHVLWHWPNWNPAFATSHEDVKAWAYYLVRHLAKRVAYNNQYNGWPVIRVSYNMTNEVTCMPNVPYPTSDCTMTVGPTDRKDRHR